MPENKKTAKSLIDGFHDRMNLLLESESYGSLAEKAGLNKGQIQSIMRGSIPGIDKVAAIAKGMDIRLDWLVFGEEPMMIKDNALSDKNMDTLFDDLEIVSQMTEHFEKHIREDDKVYTSRQVGAIVRLLCIMAYGDVKNFDPNEISNLIKKFEK